MAYKIVKALLIFTSFIFVVKIHSQIEALKLMQDWVGKWEGVYEIDDNKFNETLNIKSVFEHTYFQLTIEGESLESTRKYYSITYLTLDDNKNIIGWWFDNNGYNGMMNIKGKGDINKEILVLDCTGKLWSSKITIYFKDGKLHKETNVKVKDPSMEVSNVVIYNKK